MSKKLVRSGNKNLRELSFENKRIALEALNINVWIN